MHPHQIAKSASVQAAAASLALLAVWAPAAEGEPSPATHRPIVAWEFNSIADGVVRDASGNGHHAEVAGRPTLAESPKGQALVFDGKTTCLKPRRHPELAATSALTLDVWLWLEGGPGAMSVVDKSGERYRLTITKHRVHFGLKTKGARGDLVGGALREQTWHRVTCVFGRPKMVIYVDCRQVAEREWDYDIGAGGDLFVGMRAGRIEPFKGRVDRLRVYRAARTPRPEDESLVTSGETAMQSKMEVTTVDGGVRVDTGAIRFDLDTSRHGFVSSVSVGDKQVGARPQTPPLFATVFESGDYDGYRDSARGEMHRAAYRLDRCTHEQKDDSFSALSEGALHWPNGDSISFELSLRARAGSPHLAISVKFDRAGEFRDRFIREIGLQMPLALNERKRIVQAGDRGVQFDTRYRYQFHMHVGFLPEPDHNFWQHFHVDQATPNDYHLWRSESLATSGLSMFRGRQAAGWMTAYDQEGGLLFAYRGMSQRAPKSLYVHAPESGRACIYLHAPEHAALDLQDSRAAAQLFGDPHETDWIAFAGEELFAKPDAQLAGVWGRETLASDPPVKADAEVDAIHLWDAEPCDGQAAPLVMGGLPLPRGAATQEDNVRLFYQGKEVPLQTRAVAYWPDRSIKWLLLLFPPDGDGGYGLAPGTGEGKAIPFRLTLRGDREQEFVLHYGGETRKAGVTKGLSASEADGEVNIDAGPLKLTLGPGDRWLKSVELNGREMLRADSEPLAFVDFLRPPENYAVGTTHAEGDLDPGAVAIENLKLEESGPLRAMLRLEGMARSQEPARVIIRIEAYAGRPFVRLFHTVEFLHKDPRRAFVRRMGLRLPLRLDKTRTRASAGSQSGIEALQLSLRSGLRQTSHLNYEIWQQQAGQRHRTIAESAHRSRGWLDFSDGQGGLAVAVRNMWQESPKELVAESADTALSVNLWPESVPPMDVRRYSDYPHQGQGEAATTDSFWVDNTYYVQDPFVGVSKTHELLLLFHDGSTTGAQIDSLAADFQRPPLVYAGAKWYRDTRVALPNVMPDDPNFRRLNENFANLAKFWMFHQKYWGWYGMWDYGDVRHLFHNGYGKLIEPELLAKLLKMPVEEALKIGSRELPRRQDYFTPHDWAFDNGRWGWSNTEGLCNLFMQTQYLRTGDRDLYFFIEAMARHVRDVDMRHAGMWFGRGTRHGVQHWSDGNHEDRQTIPSEFRYYHYLNGDLRCRDFSKQLTEDWYLKGTVEIHAYHSGRLYGLLTRWEMTGDPDLGDVLRRYIHAMILPEGFDCSGAVKMPEAVSVGESKDVNTSSMFFDHFGATHALLEYYQLTEDPKLREALIKFAQEGKGPSEKAIAFAARHADDPAPYRAAIEAHAQKKIWYAYKFVSANPIHWTGHRAFLTGNVPVGLFQANTLGYVYSLFDREPNLSEKDRAAMRERDEREPLPRPPFLRESWQDEYDRPEFRDYFTPKRKLER